MVYSFSYGAGEVFSSVAANSLGAQVLPNSRLINFKQFRDSILKLVLLDVSIHLERENINAALELAKFYLN